MGRPPSNGGPSFRFSQPEVAEMEAILQAHKATMPAREILVALAEKFSKSEERSGKIEVQMKQVWNWFQNRRYAIRAKAAKSPGKLNTTADSATNNVAQATQQLSAPSAAVRPLPQAPQLPTGPAAAVRAFPQSTHHPVTFSGRVADNSQMEYEAKSARDGAWYDVATFLSHRSLETGDPEVLVRFAGFGAEEDEWVKVKKNVRQRSLPCESSECVAVLPADLILCFQEGKEQALYFDAHVLDAQRRRHDVRGCRCRFLVRYDHDQSEEIVPLRKICRRPETDYRLQQLHAVNDPLSTNQTKNGSVNTLRVYPPAETPTKQPRMENALLSPAEMPQKRQKVDSMVSAPLPEEPERKYNVEPVLPTASGEISENQSKVQPASTAPSPPPEVSQNQHEVQPVLSMPSAEASLEPQKVEPMETSPSTQPLVEQPKVESVEPTPSAPLAEVPVESHQVQDVVSVQSTEASVEPQKVETTPSPSTKVTPELQTVEPIVADQTIEPIVADPSADVLQEQHKVEPVPSAEAIVAPSETPAISSEVSLEPVAAESAVPLSAEASLEQHKPQSEASSSEMLVDPPKVEPVLSVASGEVPASSSEMLVEPHKVETVVPAASSEVSVEPHKEPMVSGSMTDPDPPLEVNHIKIDQPVVSAPTSGAEAQVQLPEISAAEGNNNMENPPNLQQENVDIEQAKVDIVGNSMLPAENP